MPTATRAGAATRLAAALTTLTLCAAALADEPAADAPPGAATLPRVVVTALALPNEPNGALPLDTPSVTGSRLGLTPRQTAASINIIDRETLDARAVRDTLEALQGVPGVVADSPPGGGGNVSMRGFSSSQVSQLFNGIDVAYVIAANPVDAWILDRVEVLGGASSFLYGQGAVGGAVNYVSKLARRMPARQEALVRGGSYGAWQGAAGVEAALGGPAAGHYVRADLSVQGWDGWVDRTDGRSLVFAGSWLADLSSRMSHTLAVEHQSKDHQPYWGTPLLNPVAQARFDPRLRFVNFNSADGAYEQDVDWVRSILEYAVAERTRVTNTAYYYDAERDYRNVETYRYDAANARVARSNTLAQKHGQTVMGNRTEAFHESSLAGLSSDWSLGLDLSRNEQTRYPSSLSATVSTADPLDFVPENFFDIPGITPATNPDRSNRVYTTAAYAENITRLGAGWSVLSGLRAEEIRIDARNFRAVNEANPDYFRRTFRPLTGRLGVMLEVTKTANAYVTYSTAADPPSGILTTVNFGSIRDWDLTTGRQLEAGAKFDFWGGRGNGTVAAYRIERENLAMPDPDNPNVSIPVGAQSSRGVEAQVGLRASATVRFQANLAVVSAQYDNFTQAVSGMATSRAGNTPVFVPERVANAFATWDFAPRWSASAGLRYVSSRWGDVANTQRFDAYTLLDAGLDWRVDRRTTVSLRGRNLADEVYVASGGATQVRLGEPRTWELVLRMAF